MAALISLALAAAVAVKNSGDFTELPGGTKRYKKADSDNDPVRNNGVPNTNEANRRRVPGYLDNDWTRVNYAYDDYQSAQVAGWQRRNRAQPNPLQREEQIWNVAPEKIDPDFYVKQNELKLVSMRLPFGAEWMSPDDFDRYELRERTRIQPPRPMLKGNSMIYA